MSNMKIGIDIGGSHIGIGLVKNGSIILKEEKFNRIIYNRNGFGYDGRT